MLVSGMNSADRGRRKGMRGETFWAPLSLLLPVGIVAAIARSAVKAAPERYVSHGMLSLLVQLHLAALLRWSAGAVGLALLIALGCLAWRLLVADSITVSFRNPERLWLPSVLGVCCLLFASLGWSVNCYCLPGGRYEPKSLVFDACLLAALALLGWFLVSRPGRTLLRRAWRGCRAAYGGLRKAAVPLFCVTVLLCAAGAVAQRARRPSGPNIVLLVIDCLRPDHVGCYGHSRPTTPNIDRLAQRGTIFRNVFANASWTKPSVGSMLTSRYPAAHQATSQEAQLSRSELTLPEILQNEGYRTAFVNGGNHFISHEFTFDQGFDHYKLTENRADVVADDFIALLPTLRRSAFFAYLHFMDAHCPYTLNEHTTRFVEDEGIHFSRAGHVAAKDVRRLLEVGIAPPGEKDYLLNVYDGQIAFVDENVQRVVAAVEAAGRGDNTVFVVAGDHGEEFWDHGGYEHGHTMYQELLHVPMILSGGGIPVAERDDAVQLIDLAPSLLALAGGEPARRDFNGDDVGLASPFVPGGGTRPHLATGMLYGPERYVLIDGTRKLIATATSDDADTAAGSSTNGLDLELYDLAADPGEQHDLRDVSPEEAVFMELRLADLLKSHRSDRPRALIQIDKELERQLRSIGYTR